MDFLKVMSLHGGAIQRKFLPSSVDREKKGGSVKSSRTDDARKVMTIAHIVL